MSTFFTRIEAQARIDCGLGKPHSMTERRWQTVLMHMRTNGIVPVDRAWRVYVDGAYALIVDAVDAAEAEAIVKGCLGLTGETEIKVDEVF